MKKLVISAIVILVLTVPIILSTCSDYSLPTEGKKYDMKVLFVGNSYTKKNDLPQIFEKLCKSGGKVVYQVSSTKGGARLSKHADSDSRIGKKTTEKLENEAIDWDYVVLQEQSIMPVVDEFEFERGVEYMVESTRAVGAEPALYMTWGRQDGFESMSFEEMNEALEESYKTQAELHDALLLPAGSVWGQLREKNEDLGLKLWDEDGSHPSYLGSYLNACVFYSVFFDESPVGLWYDSDMIEKADAEAVQKFVWDYIEQN